VEQLKFVLEELKSVLLEGLQKLRLEQNVAMADHQFNMFILDSLSYHYQGRLCKFGICPKGKPECLVPGCGAVPFLQQHKRFHWNANILADARSLFCRRSRSPVANSRGL